MPYEAWYIYVKFYFTDSKGSKSSKSKKKNRRKKDHQKHGASSEVSADNKVSTTKQIPLSLGIEFACTISSLAFATEFFFG